MSCDNIILYLKDILDHIKILYKSQISYYNRKMCGISNCNNIILSLNWKMNYFSLNIYRIHLIDLLII